MTDPFETPRFSPKQLQNMLGVNAVTLRSWKRRGVTNAIGVSATGERSQYSLIECALFRIAKRLIDMHVEPRTAFDIAGWSQDHVRKMVRNPNPFTWALWLIVTVDKEDPTLLHVWPETSVDDVGKLFQVAGECGFVVDAAGAMQRAEFFLTGDT